MMASDKEYADFLDRANQDMGGGGGGGGGSGSGGGGAAKTAATAKDGGGGGGFKTMDSGAKVPEPLAKLAAADAQVYYTSDTDEPFEPVALTWSGGGGGGGGGGDGSMLPDEDEFAKLVGHPNPEMAEVGIMDPLEWDAAGQYAEVVEAVRRAGRGSDVRVYRMAKGGARAEYWVVTMEGGDKKAPPRMVGMRALAVET